LALNAGKEEQNKGQNDLFYNAKDKYNEEKEEINKLVRKEENLRDFPIFVLGNYVEMIKRNGWVAYHILKNVKATDFMPSNQGRQFLCMLQIEAASVIDEFMDMIYRDYSFSWDDINKSEEPDKRPPDAGSTEKIKEYFRNFNGKDNDLTKTNKYLVVKETFLDNTNIWEKEEFVNFLWIKQLLYDDNMDKNLRLSDKNDYEEKIISIIDKIKGFFPDKNIQAFFIVTDGQEIPYVQYHENYFLSEFKKFYIQHKMDVEKLEKEISELKKENQNTEETEGRLKQLMENPDIDLYKFPEFITFLNGRDDMQFISCETTAEYFYDNGEWENANNAGKVNFDFMPSGAKWLYLVRISEFKENNNNDKNRFIAQGLLGFYSGNDLRDAILPKQLLMLLRRDMSAFVRNHHKNDEFSRWVLEKEKADGQFMRLHSINTYDNAIKYYKNMITKKDNNMDIYIKYLFTLETWLAGRILLLCILDKETKEEEKDKYNYEVFKIEDFINAVFNDYKHVISFHKTNMEIVSDTDIAAVDKFVQLSYDGISDLDKNIEVTYLKKLKEQIIFEVFYNIRKHVLKYYYKKITKNNLQVKIELNIAEKDNIKYFVISNNFCSRKLNERNLNNKIRGNEQHGLNFINNVFSKLDIAGEVFIKLDNSSESEENNKYKLYIPISYKERLT
jgi:hypothetical protein